MYEGDAPLAERRAAALSLDRDLLDMLLGAEELRELLDPQVLADLEIELQQLVETRYAKTQDELHDLLRRLGDLGRDDIDIRTTGPAQQWVDSLIDDRRAITVVVAGTERIIAAEDAGIYRDALGCALPLGLPEAFTVPVATPLLQVVGRFSRTHGPFVARDVARRFGVSEERAISICELLEAQNRLVRGEFRPGGTEREWCDVDVLRQLRRRSLAALRKEVEPVESQALARFLPAWHHITSPLRGLDGLVTAVGLLQGASIVGSALETDVLPLRVRGYKQTDLDELCASGEVVWVGAGSIGAHDGRLRLFFADQLAQLAPAIEWPEPPSSELHHTLRLALQERGAMFFSQIRAAAPSATESEVLTALWDLVWSVKSPMTLWRLCVHFLVATEGLDLPGEVLHVLGDHVQVDSRALVLQLEREDGVLSLRYCSLDLPLLNRHIYTHCKCWNAMAW
jgi:ATP-dependent helicase Lhr and Lhr-like helicase